MEESILSFAKRFFSQMNIDYEDISVVCQESEKGIYLLTLQSADSHLLIGPRGASLQEIRHLITLLIEKTYDCRIHLHLEINDYLAKKDEKLFRYIDKKIEYVMEEKTQVTFRQFSAYDRKKIHAYVSEKHVPGLLTFSTDDEAGNRLLNLSYASIETSEDELDLDGVGI